MHVKLGEWHCNLVSGMGHSVKLYLGLPVQGDKVRMLRPDGSIEEIGLHDEDTTPFAQIPEDALQELMNALWNKGLRPQARRYEVEADLLREQLTIQEKHLKDMQRLVFSPSKVEDGGHG